MHAWDWRPAQPSLSSDAPCVRVSGALGYHDGMSEIDTLKARIEELEALLAEANAELAKLGDDDPIHRVIKLYEQLTEEQKEEVLILHIFHTDAAATCMVGRMRKQRRIWNRNPTTPTTALTPTCMVGRVYAQAGLRHNRVLHRPHTPSVEL